MNNLDIRSGWTSVEITVSDVWLCYVHVLWVFLTGFLTGATASTEMVVVLELTTLEEE